MTPVYHFFVVVLVLSNLMLLGSSRLGTLIRTVAVQGIALGCLSLMVQGPQAQTATRLFACLSIFLKGIVFPWLLFRALRLANVRREVEPFVGYSTSMLLGIGSLAMGYWMAARLPLPNPQLLSPHFVPVAMFTMMTGLFLIITRRKALTQVVGYLTLENGIYVFGVALLREWTPLLVELGILLDAFVAVFVMGITIFHISREFDHIDTDQMAALKDFPGP